MDSVRHLMRAAVRGYTATGPQQQQMKEATLKSLLSALWNLSAHCRENKRDICEVEGALETLVRTLTYSSPSKTLAVVENGGGILRNVSSHIAQHENLRQVNNYLFCMAV